MLYDVTAIIAGLLLLIKSADLLILGAATIARYFGISPLIVGITVIGFGTSAPEIMVAIISSLEENQSLAIGNAIGSNITNITLVLGVTALVKPLEVHSRILKKELPLLFAALLIAVFLLSDEFLGRTDGVILSSLLILLMWWISREALKSRGMDPLQQEYDQELPETMPIKKAGAILFGSLVLLIISSKLLVYGAVNIAIAFGLSELVIGLTIIAIGTSLPELAASAMGAIKGEHELAVGNVVGSNLFNTLIVLGIPGIITPAALDPNVMERDMPIMFVLTAVLIIMAYGLRGAGKISRPEGFLLLSAFIAYQALLYSSISGN